MQVTRAPLRPQDLLHLRRENEAISAGYKVSRSLLDISERSILKVDLIAEMTTLVNTKSRVIEVLDGGCGTGFTLEQIKLRLPGKVRTTGLTLNEQHLEASTRYEYQIDEMIIGPIQEHKFNRQYDFIVDFLGANFYFPMEIIPIYGKILSLGGECFVKFPLQPAELARDQSKRCFSSDLGSYAKFFNENGLGIIQYADSGLETDFLLRSIK